MAKPPPKVERQCLVAKIQFDGWVCLPDCVPFEQAIAKRQDDARYVVLRDPDDDAAIAAYERAQLPLNQARWQGKQPRPQTNDE